MGIILEAEESDFAGFIDDGTIYAAQLVSIKPAVKPFKDDEGNEIHKLEFKFRLIADDPDDPHDGVDLWGETGTKLKLHPNCKLTAWAETLLGGPIIKGQKFNTDDLVDRRCRVVIGRKDTKDQQGRDKTRNFVSDVIPSREAMAASGANIGGVKLAGSLTPYDDEEPFVVDAGTWWPEVGMGMPPERRLP